MLTQLLDFPNGHIQIKKKFFFSVQMARHTVHPPKSNTKKVYKLYLVRHNGNIVILNN